MRQSLISSIAFFVVSVPAVAQDIDCAKDTGSYVTQYCSSLEFEAADKRLNLSYKRLMGLLRNIKQFLRKFNAPGSSNVT